MSTTVILILCRHDLMRFLARDFVRLVFLLDLL